MCMISLLWIIPLLSSVNCSVILCFEGVVDSSSPGQLEEDEKNQGTDVQMRITCSRCPPEWVEFDECDSKSLREEHVITEHLK